jgi:hypothetical protein
MAWALRGLGWIMPLIVAGVATIAGAVLWVQRPVGESVIVQGSVASFSQAFEWRRARGIAIVSVDAEQVRVGMPAQSNCLPGDDLALSKQGHAWGGARYVAAGPCRRPVGARHGP